MTQNGEKWEKMILRNDRKWQQLMHGKRKMKAVRNSEQCERKFDRGSFFR
jgi:hypothetical protein